MSAKLTAGDKQIRLECMKLAVSLVNSSVHERVEEVLKTTDTLYNHVIMCNSKSEGVDTWASSKEKRPTITLPK
jgi:hypothetical protein